jgi:hypothetical protein
VRLTFHRDKETKGAVRFEEDSDDPVIGYVYVRKSALTKQGVAPNAAQTVTIDFEVSA